MNHAKEAHKAKKAPTQETKSGYRTVLIITTLAAVIYLAFIFISSI